MSELALIFSKHIKHNSVCLICGSSHQLNYHHVTPTFKLSEVYKVAMMGDLQQTITEINKCVTLCAADHRAVHRGQITGWLNGRFDQGGRSNAVEAKKYMPYLQWLARAKPAVMLEFYKKFIERDSAAMSAVFNAAEIELPVPQYPTSAAGVILTSRGGPDNRASHP